MTVRVEEEVGVNVRVELNNEEDKIKVMQNKNTERVGDKIFINNDLSQEDRGIQNMTRQRAKEENIKKKSIKIKCMKLIIEDKVWKWNRQIVKLEKIGTMSSVGKKELWQLQLMQVI